MILQAISSPGRQPQRPHIVWLHGFMGSHREWEVLSQACGAWPQLRIDLPGHGASAACRVSDFAEMDALLTATLRHYGITHYWLAGYSLGGRIAMYHATQERASGLCGLIVEGGHPGLRSAGERTARSQHDARWAERLRQEPFREVLTAWYQQPLFRDLTARQRAALVALRQENDPAALAAMLEATSLSRQPDLRTALHKLTIPFYYLCGERDKKFRSIAQELGLTPYLIADAGHNAHREAPEAFAARLFTLLGYSDFKDLP